MDEDDSLFLELMLQAETFCNQIEGTGKKNLPLGEMHLLSLKISQCRGALRELQERYENDELTIADSTACATFRNALISLLWASFLGRRFIDRKLFRKLVQVDSGFTYLLITRRSKKRGDS